MNRCGFQFPFYYFCTSCAVHFVLYFGYLFSLTYDFLTTTSFVLFHQHLCPAEIQIRAVAATQSVKINDIVNAKQKEEKRLSW